MQCTDFQEAQEAQSPKCAKLSVLEVMNNMQDKLNHYLICLQKRGCEIIPNKGYSCWKSGITNTQKYLC